jgi:hypothetical protein
MLYSARDEVMWRPFVSENPECFRAFEDFRVLTKDRVEHGKWSGDDGTSIDLLLGRSCSL